MEPSPWAAGSERILPRWAAFNPHGNLCCGNCYHSLLIHDQQAHGGNNLSTGFGLGLSGSIAQTCNRSPINCCAESQAFTN